MGIACDWGQPLRVRGVDHPKSGYFQNTKQRITVVDKDHPITQGLGDGFEIYREVVRQVGEQDRDVGYLGHDCRTAFFCYVGNLLIVRPNEVFEKLCSLYREGGSKIARRVELLPVT